MRKISGRFSRLIAYVSTLIAAVLICSVRAAADPGASGQTAPAMDRALFSKEVSRSLHASGAAYIYFHAGSRPASRKWMGRIEKWAKNEKAGWFVADAEASPAIAADYGIAYTPTALRLQRGYGVVEAHIGPSDVGRYAKDPRIGKIPAFAKRVVNTTKTGASLIIEFYAEWCVPCREVTPLLQRVEAKSGGKIKVMRINVDGESDGIRLYGVEGPPENVLIDPDGAVRRRFRRIDRPETVLDFARQNGLL